VAIQKDILIIDDSVPFCESIYDLIVDESDWSAEFVNNGENGIAKLKEYEYNIVLLDLKMPGMSGLEVLGELSKLDLIRSNYIIVLTGEITIENAVDSLQFGAKDFIQKPTVVEYPDIFIERIKKGFDWQEALVLGILLILFLPSRRFFYRKSSLFAIPFSWSWLAFV